MKRFSFYGWDISQDSTGWHIANVTGSWDSPEQCKAWVLSFEGGNTQR